MRLLHLGSGFRPWRRGGLVAYAEDLMETQARRGDEVTYLFSGRQYPGIRGPRLRRWERDGTAMLEVVNSPLYDHGRQPELELSEPRIERLLEGVIAEVRPDVVHVQEFAGLPSSVIDVARRLGVPTIVTLQDYFALCSTFKLLDADGRVCMRREIGVDCVATTAADARRPSLMFEASVNHDVKRLPLLRHLPPAVRDPPIHRISRVLSRRAVRADGGAPADAAAFQRRREVNVERLNRADRVIAMSHRVAEIHATLGVDPARLRTLTLTLGHIERLRLRRASGRAPVTFATLGAFESVAKGGQLVLDALRPLAASAAAGRLRLLVFGSIERGFIEEATAFPGVELRGPYRPDQLDDLLAEVDVGLMPSIWEEAYGYAGIEFLAKGIPVIGNAIGGIPEYVSDGQTGWLNRSCSAPELTRIIEDVVKRPEQVAHLNAKLRARRSSIKPLAVHAREMEEIYAESIEARRRVVSA